MEYKKGTLRDQLILFTDSLDSLISQDSHVRVIDMYVENLNLVRLGFKIPELKTGTPPYNPKLLLKIYIYGYFEKIRTSRKLENECKRNMELIWLTEELTPDFKTIADFRKDNKEALINLFKEFLYFCKAQELLSLKTIGIDGTKIRAQNSQNNIYKRESIEDLKKRIDKKISEYLFELEINDEKDAEELYLKCGEQTKSLIDKLKKLGKYKGKTEKIEQLFDKNPELKTYFANDEDSRFQSDKGKVRAGYNVQTAVDDENKLIIVNEVSNKSNDLEQMTPMIEKVESIKKDLMINEDTDAIMDAGYFNEKEIINNKDKKGINVIVSDKQDAQEGNKKRKQNQNENKIPADGFETKDFIYDKDRDICVCPDGKHLFKTHKNPGKEKSGRQVFEYLCRDCAGCKSLTKCTRNKRGRSIKISVNKETMENYKKEMQKQKNKKLLSKRKEIVEHPFGTIKRYFGYTYFVQKGFDKVKAEFNLICFTYNFKRVLNILGVEAFKKALES